MVLLSLRNPVVAALRNPVVTAARFRSASAQKLSQAIVRQLVRLPNLRLSFVAAQDKVCPAANRVGRVENRAAITIRRQVSTGERQPIQSIALIVVWFRCCRRLRGTPSWCCCCCAWRLWQASHTGELLRFQVNCRDLFVHPRAPILLQNGPSGRKVKACRTVSWLRSPPATFVDSAN